MKKKITALAVAVIMAFLVLPVCAFAETGICGENAQWALTPDGTLTISGTGSIKDYKATYTGEAIDGAAPWIEHRDRVREIVIQDGITKIGEYSFMGMGNAVKLTIPESVTEIAGYAFDGCYNLESLTLPQGLKSIGEYAFHGVAVPEVTIPAGVEKIGDLAFSGRIIQYYTSTDYLPANSIFKNIYVNSGNKKFFSDNGVLYEKLSNGRFRLLIYPAGKTDETYEVLAGTSEIGDYGFYCNQYLSGVKLSDGVRSVGKLAFFACENLNEITIPASLTTIAEGAFPTNEMDGIEPHIENIYYGGKEADWQKVAIGEYNEALTRNAQLHYSENNGSSQQKPASNEIGIFLNGNKIPFDQPPVIRNGRTLVPMRAIFEALGASVDWDDATRTASSKKGNTSVSVTIDENILYKNGNPIEIDVPAQIINDRTMIPIRAVSEAYGCTVYWDDDTRSAIIETSQKIPEPQKDYSAYDAKINEYKDALAMSDADFDEKYGGGGDCSSINAVITRFRRTDGGKIVYSLYDVDKNGVDELLISDMNSVIDIYTLKINGIVKLYPDCYFGERIRLYVLNDGRLLSEGAGGASMGLCEIGVISADGAAVEVQEAYYCNLGGELYDMDGYTYMNGEDYYELLDVLTAKSVFGTLSWTVIK
ncbi:MAG: leucine-rich repeat protein [Firmicutes bacterium]|nr:leucine-rich repeat protein [Bacillota bacterium]